MRTHPAAHRHGVEDIDAIWAAENPVYSVPLDDDDTPHRELRIGFDTAGRLLEIVILHFDSGNELIIHAMKARPQYRQFIAWNEPGTPLRP